MTDGLSFRCASRQVAVGIFHCAKNQGGRLRTVAETWAPSLLRTTPSQQHPNDLRAVLLASRGGVAASQQRSQFPPSSLVVVEEARDDYPSTLPKGLLGLLGMFERFPTAKWFAVTGDDVFIDPHVKLDPPSKKNVGVNF
jgi:hypothetical protein